MNNQSLARINRHTVNKIKIPPIFFLLFIAFIIRLSVPILVMIITKDKANFHTYDTITYLDPARELIFSGQFASKLEWPGTESPSPDSIPEIVRTPGYPVFLIPGILLGNLELVTIAQQIVLSCATVYMVYRIALIVFERIEVAHLCALLYALEPLSILYASRLMTETLFTFLITLSLYYLLIYQKSKSLSHILLSSFALAGSIYVRPVGYFLPILITLILIIWVLAQPQKRQILFIHAFVFLFVSMGLLGLWQVRNKIQADYSGFSAVTDMNLYFFAGAAVLSVQQGIPVYEMQNQMGYRDTNIYLLNHPEQRNWNQDERYTYMRREGIKLIRDNLGISAIIHLNGMLRVLFDPGANEYLRLFNLYSEPHGILGAIIDRGLMKTLTVLWSMFLRNPLIPLSNILLGLILAMYLLWSIVGLRSKDLTKKSPLIILLCTASYLLIVSGGPVGTDRFRLPIMPIICVLAGYGLSRVITVLSASSHIRRQLCQEN
jgi:4-amino-4-deoxy-L-arabinose transferase-like glycosyltransferase